MCAMFWHCFFQLQILRLSLQMLGAGELILGQIHLISRGLCTARYKQCRKPIRSQTFEYIFRKQVVPSHGSYFLVFLKFLEHAQRAKSGKKLTANIAYVHFWSNRGFWKHQFKMALVLAGCFNYSAGQLLRASFTGIFIKRLRNYDTHSTTHVAQGQSLQRQ